jgi:Asp-tRNA(Asn)/Glu-tRNA(Gln) amidotransferase A subunit family amidase
LKPSPGTTPTTRQRRRAIHLPAARLAAAACASAGSKDFKKFGDGIRPALAALEVLKKLGADVREAKLPEFPYGAVAGTVISAEGATCFADLIRSGRIAQLVDERQRKSLAEGLDVKAADYLRAMQIRRSMQQALAKLYNEVDLLVSPSLLFPANPMEMDLDKVFRGGSGIGAGGNLAGLPGLGVPMGFVNNLPVGLSFVGKPFDEATVVRAGRAYQQATDWHTRRPHNRRRNWKRNRNSPPSAFPVPMDTTMGWSREKGQSRAGPKSEHSPKPIPISAAHRSEPRENCGRNQGRE